jgi:transcriptional regulator
MYTPKEFALPAHQELISFLKENAFATLISVTDLGLPIATHLPLVIKEIEDELVFEGHISNANKHSFLLNENKEILVVFQGANGYVSSSVYENENVPTWNYQTVHAQGKVNAISEIEMEQHLAELVDTHESSRENSLEYKNFNPKMISSYKLEISGFRIKVKSLEGAFKLSQNRSEKDQKAIVEDLERCPHTAALAKAMKDNL